MNRPPATIMKKAYINLDALFGHVFSYVTGEPITPSKIAVIYLLRILFQTHFGHRHVRSKFRPFCPEEKQIVFQLLYSLIDQEYDPTYRTFRTALRIVFQHDRNILLNFVACMEEIGSGTADVNLSIEDEFYTNKYSRDPKLPWDDPAHFAVQEAAKDDLQFSSAYSHMYRWLKRVLAQYAKTSTTKLFKINKQMRYWINCRVKRFTHKDRIGSYLPHDVNCSIRAREWIAEHMYYLQMNPHFLAPYDHILVFTEEMRERQPDILELYLLESVLYYQLQDSQTALERMKSFFELSMFELNNNMKHCVKTFRLGVPSQTPLMYAPILQARLHRYFGDIDAARALLRESVQQAQLRNDEICHQMGNTELHTVEIIGKGPLLEDKTGKQAENGDKDPRIVRKALKHIDDLHGHSRAGPCCPNTEDDFELVAELDSYGKMLMLLKSIAEGTYQLKYHIAAETGISCPLGNDLMCRGINVTNYGFAIMSSNMIRNGMYDQARTTALGLLSNNVRTSKTTLPLTESHAVAVANAAYSHAAAGNFKVAMKMVFLMKRFFKPRLLWHAHRHYLVCAAIVNFDRLFLLSKYKAANKAMALLFHHSELEYNLRRGLVLAASGQDRDAMNFLQQLKVVDIRGRIRRHMQLATVYTANRFYDMTEKELNEAMELARTTTLFDIPLMVKRRLATMKCCQGKHHEALAIVKEISEGIQKYGTFTERACFYMTAARSTRLIGQDSRHWLKEVRVLVRNKQWPTMEKLVLTEVAALHHTSGLLPNASRLSQICEQFGKLHTQYPGRCEWLLI